MTKRGVLLPFLILLSVPAVGPAAPRVVAASGAWAARAGPTACEAASRAFQPAANGQVQARAAIAFDAAPGGRRGQLALHLGHVPRPGSTVMLTVGDVPFLLVSRGDWAWSRGPAQEAAIISAMRSADGMRVEARSPGGGRYTDRFDLTGAPTAIDAAAACALGLAKSRPLP